MKTYKAKVNQLGQMGWCKELCIKVKADTIDEAKEKVNRWCEKKGHNSQYKYQLVSIREEK